MCGTHEYTFGNLNFARALEPGNLELINDMERYEERRARDLPTLPSAIGQEQPINPSLRTRVHGGASPTPEMKNQFR